MTTEARALRPKVQKHLAYFQECIVKHGAPMVCGVLKSKDGQWKGGRLHFTLSKKDKYQMLQALGLMGKGGTDGTNACILEG